MPRPRLACSSVGRRRRAAEQRPGGGARPARGHAAAGVVGAHRAMVAPAARRARRRHHLPRPAARGRGSPRHLSELDPKVSWRDGAVRFGASGSREVDVSGTDLVLIPSVFAWPGAAVSFDPPAVIYPARGVYGLWQQRPRSSEDLARAHRPDAGGLGHGPCGASVDNRPGRPHGHTSEQRERAPGRPARERAGVHHANRPLPRPSPHRLRPGASQRLADSEGGLHQKPMASDH